MGNYSIIFICHHLVEHKSTTIWWVQWKIDSIYDSKFLALLWYTLICRSTLYFVWIQSSSTWIHFNAPFWLHQLNYIMTYFSSIAYSCIFLARIRNPIWRFGLLLLLLLLLLWIYGFVLSFGWIQNSYNKVLILSGFDGTHLHQLFLFLSQWLHEVFQWWHPPILSCDFVRVECWHKHWII